MKRHELAKLVGDRREASGVAGAQKANCEGKVPFDSYQLATQVRGRRERRRNDRSHVYRCEACGKWHIGSPPPKSATLYRKRAGILEPA